MSIGSWGRGWKRAQAPKTIRRPRLGLEALEDRTTPAVTANLNAGVLTVSLSADDNVTVGGDAAAGTLIAVLASNFPQQNFNGVTSIVVQDTSAGVATNQRVGFTTLDGTTRIGMTGAVTVTGIEEISLNSLSLPMSASNITFSGARVVNTINTVPQLATSGTISITASGTGDAIGTAANPIRVTWTGGPSFTTNTTAGNGNQYFDFGGTATNVNVGLGGQLNAGSGTITLTNGQFAGNFGSEFGDSTTFNIGTGGALSVVNTETIGGLTGTGIVGASASGTHTLVVGGGNVSSTFNGTLQNVAPFNSGAGVLALQKAGTGTFVLGADSSYTGTTTISAGGVQVGGGGTTGTLGTGAVVNNSLLTFFRSDAHTIANAISGTGGIAQLGSGVVTLTGANTYAGTTQIDSGRTLRVGNGGTTGSIGAGNVFNGGTIVFNRSNPLFVPANITGSTLVRQEGTGITILTGANTYTGTTTIAAGTLQIGTTGTLGSGNVVNNGTLVVERTNDFTLDNVISGNGNLTKFLGGGNLTLTANNTYTGTTTILSGTLQIGTGGTTGTIGSGLIVNNATLTFNRSDNLLVGNEIVGIGRLAKLGAGLLTLTNANSYSGGTTISNGQIQFSNSTALGTGTVTLVDANTVTGNNPTLLSTGATNLTVANNIVVGSTGQVGFIGSSGAATGSVNYTGTITLSQSMFILAGTSSTFGTRFSGRITGTGNVNVQNGGTPGSLAILDNPSDTNDFTGGVSIANDVVLRLTQSSSAGQIPDAATVNFFTAGATLRLFITIETIAALNAAPGVGVIEATGNAGGTSILIVGGGDTSGTFGGVLRDGTNGVLQLVKTGAGTQTLSGFNTYTGTTTVSGGTLLVNGTIANGPAATDVTTTGNGVIGGFGTIQGTTVVTSGGSLLPGNANTVGTLNTGNVTFNAGSFFGVKMTGFRFSDSLNVTGTVNLGGATLFAIETPAALGTHVIITNDGNDPIVGTFAGLPEGATFIGDNGKPFRISYVGGDGNDVTLTPETLPTRLLATGPGTGSGLLFSVNAGQYGNPQNVSLIPGFAGEIRVARVDVNGDGAADLVAGSGPGGSRIRILSGLDNSTVIADFNAFPGFAGGVYVAGGDLNGDGFEDLVVTGDGADAFSGPVANGLGVRIYSGATLAGGNPPVLASFNGLASLSGAQGEGAAVRLGGRPAVADVNGDARPDVLIAAGNGGGPRVVIWPAQAFFAASSGQPPVNPIANLFVFESTQRGGAFLTAGDLNGDGFADIAVGGGPGGGPRVRTVNSFLMLGLPNLEAVNLDDPTNLANGLVLNNFFSGNPNNRGGVRVAMRDADLDGFGDLVTASGTNEQSQIRIYSDAAILAAFGTSSEPGNPQAIDPFNAVLAGGVWIG